MASESHKFISRIRSENCASAAASLPNAETCLRRAGVATTATACLPRTKTKPDAATKNETQRACVCVCCQYQEPKADELKATRP